MTPALLLLTDSRLPAGGHAHSGGAERAVASGAVHDVPTLRSFLRGRLHTAGLVATALTAAACAEAAATPTVPAPDSASDLAMPNAVPDRTAPDRTAPDRTGPDRTGPDWALLDAEADARTAAPAQREASRTQGRLLLRVARRVWPSPVLDRLALDVPNPHHPIALGAAAHAAGATPEEAALAAAYQAISGPATAAVRLLGLDPVAVHALLAELTPDLTAVAAQACLSTAACGLDPASGPDPTSHWASRWGALPAHSAPGLDLLAEQHARAEVRLFVS
ncbi:urease accessory UreF family protein [Nonomuraea antimicrobica]|uniref:Urease accessory protein UreF n=2 Tax=Nonomuraea antimicrobica TaxID=561173 RepID=A0ABP7DI24_9ACTN